MVNYSNGKIYKIESITGEGNIYIGSTTKKYLSQRMDTHRKDYKRWKNGKMHKITSYDIFDIYGVENCQIILIESYPCETKDELQAREKYYIKSMQCVNKCVPGRSHKEYEEDNKERIQEYKKEYYQKNIEKVKEYNIINKDKISERKKRYIETHNEENKEYRKNYYEKNKDKIQEQQKKEYICICGSVIHQIEKSRHEKSKKHLKYLETLTVII